MALTGEVDDESVVLTVTRDSEPTEVIDGEAPSWSPDGSQLAFARVDG
jgi:Tol biopolymer transport system component